MVRQECPRGELVGPRRARGAIGESHMERHFVGAGVRSAKNVIILDLDA
jgi:hypothetical protein